MVRLRRRLKTFIWFMSITTILSLFNSNSVFAAPTIGQVKAFMAAKAVPNWQKAALEMQKMREELPDKSSKEIWLQLDTRSKSGSGTEALTKAGSPNTYDELQTYSMWLRLKILSEAADGRYSYVYARNLSLMSSKGGDFTKEAAVFFYHARLALSIDGAHCEGPSSSSGVIAGYENQANFRSVLEKIDKLSPSEKAVAMLEAVAIEEMRGETPPLQGLCAKSVRTVVDALKQGRQIQKVETSDANKGMPGGTTNITVDTSGIEPKFISHEQWIKARREILDQAILKAANSL